MAVPPTPYENRTMCTYMSCRYNNLPSAEQTPDPDTLAADWDPTRDEIAEMRADIERWLAERRREHAADVGTPPPSG